MEEPAKKAAVKKKEKTPMYKGKPLVRSGDVIYYGDMSEPYVAMLQVTESKEFEGLKLPTKVAIQILSTDEDLRPKERIKKRTEKGNLYDAMNIATIWLDRMLEE